MQFNSKRKKNENRLHGKRKRFVKKNIHVNKKQIWLLNYTQHSLFF